MGTPLDRQVAPLRPLGGTELLDSAVRAVWAQRRAAFPIAVPIAVVVAALGAVLQYATIDSTSATLLSSVGTLLTRVLAGTILGGLLAPAVSRSLLNERLDAAGCLRAVGWRWVTLVALAVVVTIAEGVGLALFFIGGIWLWGVWAVAGPALTVEGLGPLRALRRSYGLISGDFWRVWGVRALGWLVTYVIGVVAVLPFEIIALIVAKIHSFAQPDQAVGRPGLYVAILSIGTVIGLVVTVPITAAVDTLIYTDLRMRREGMDISMGLPPRADGPPLGARPPGRPSPAAPGVPAAPW